MEIITMRRLAAIVFTLSLATAASADQPAGFVTFTVDKPNPDTVGTWTVTGAIADEGTCCVDAAHRSSGISGVFHIIDDLVGHDGTIIWQSDAMFNGRALGNHVVALAGSWRIIGGTGAYAGATGQGQISGTYNQSTEEIHSVNTGVIKLVPGALEFRTVKQ